VIFIEKSRNEKGAQKLVLRAFQIFYVLLRLTIDATAFM
tara:strand:+ start:319 stop:435 length:117 start_codon:yes stop_codon:yes gene_type:complete